MADPATNTSAPADAIAAKFAQYEADTIPAGTFGGSPAQPEDEVKTINFSHYIVARASLSELVVDAFKAAGPRGIAPGWYEVPTCARRHLARPLRLGVRPDIDALG